MRPVPLPGPLVAAGMTGLSSPRAPASRSSNAGDPAVDRRLPLRLLDSSARPRTQPRVTGWPLRFPDSPAPEPALVMSPAAAPALRSSGTGPSRGPAGCRSGFSIPSSGIWSRAPAAGPAPRSPAPDPAANLHTIGEW